MLRQTLSQKMLQKLSPQQIQLMKLLQVPTVALEQRIKEELEANPALDEGVGEESSEFDQQEEGALSSTDDQNEEDYQDDSYDFDEYLNEYIEDDPASYKLRSDNSYSDEEEKTIPIAVEDSFHDYLEQQLGMLALKNEKQEIIAQQIIGSIDDDGYLRREPIAILDDLMFSQNIFAEEAEVLEVLKKIQRFDPPGIGARDLQECLKIQLELKLEREEFLDDEQIKWLKYGIRIITKYFDEFTKKHYEKLIRQLNVTEAQLKNAIDEILKCNPKPASGYSSNTSGRGTQYLSLIHI